MPIKAALIFPWNADVDVGGLLLPPSLDGDKPSHHLLGGAITPSRVLPFGILGLLVNGAYPAPGNPLILITRYSTTLSFLCVPLPSNNMFLCVMAQAWVATPTCWLLLSAAAEFMLSSGLQPPPRSVCLGSFFSFPDWEDHKTAPVFSATAPPSEVPPFLLRSGFLAYGAYGRLMSSLPVPAGKTRLQMGPCGYADDILNLCLRPLVLPLLSAFVELPHAYLRGSAPGSALVPGLFSGPAAASPALYRRPSRPACSSS